MNCIVHVVTKSWTQLSDFHFPFHVLQEQIQKFSSQEKQFVTMCVVKDVN